MKKFEENLQLIGGIHPDTKSSIINAIKERYTYTCPCVYTFHAIQKHEITTPITVLAIYRHGGNNMYYTISKFKCPHCNRTHYIFLPVMRSFLTPHVVETVPMYAPTIVCEEAITEITNFLHKLSPNYYSPALSVTSNIVYLLNQYTSYSLYSISDKLSPLQLSALRNAVNSYYVPAHNLPTFQYFALDIARRTFAPVLPNLTLYTTHLLNQLQNNNSTQALVSQLLNITPNLFNFQPLLSI